MMTLVKKVFLSEGKNIFTELSTLTPLGTSVVSTCPPKEDGGSSSPRRENGPTYKGPTGWGCKDSARICTRHKHRGGEQRRKINEQHPKSHLAVDLHLPGRADRARPSEPDQGVPQLAGGRLHHHRPQGRHPLPLRNRLQPE